MTPATGSPLAGLVPEGGRPLVMGVVNVTPDSFSDGGKYLATEAAVEHGLALLGEGADILDIGGESTRPGATRPLVAEELDRVVPVIAELSARGAVISVDTMRAEVAAAAVAAGARIVNDVSGGLADPDMVSTVAGLGAAYVAMHWRGHAADMQTRALYDDVVAQVRDELDARVEAALAAGIGADRLIIDPGLGFAKTADHNWELLRDLPALNPRGLPMLVGGSRKNFLGLLLADAEGRPRPVLDREDANVALTTLIALSGAWAVRVHEVRASVDALKVAARWLGPAHPPVTGRVEDDDE